MVQGIPGTVHASFFLQIGLLSTHANWKWFGKRIWLYKWTVIRKTEEINEVIKKKLTQLKNNYLSNAKVALHEYLETEENWTEGRKLMSTSKITSTLAKDSNGTWLCCPPTRSTTCMVTLLESTGKNGLWSKYGPLSRQAACNEKYVLYTKQIRCQMIGCHQFNYKPVGDTSLIDSSNYNGYVEYDRPKSCDIFI